MRAACEESAFERRHVITHKMWIDIKKYIGCATSLESLFWWWKKCGALGDKLQEGWRAWANKKRLIKMTTVTNSRTLVDIILCSAGCLQFSPLFLCCQLASRHVNVSVYLGMLLFRHSPYMKLMFALHQETPRVLSKLFLMLVLNNTS